MIGPKFTYKECSWTCEVCSCYEKSQYEYLKKHMQHIVDSRMPCGDDIREFIRAVLAEVEKPYEDAKV